MIRDQADGPSQPHRAELDVYRDLGSMHIKSYSWTTAEQPKPGTWRLRRNEQAFTATWSCPDCGASADFGPGTDYAIDADGKVLPLYECPTVECDYRGVVRLSGWDARELFADRLL